MIRQPAFNRAVFALTFGAAMLTATAVRADNYPDSHMVPAAQASQLSRAEVLADLKIYQESGLADAERIVAEGGVETASLHKAKERYAQLRQGERYATLVAQIAQRIGEPVRHPRGA